MTYIEQGPKGDPLNSSAGGAPEKPTRDQKAVTGIHPEQPPRDPLAGLVSPTNEAAPSTNRASSVASTWAKDAIDSREYTPWSERPLLQRILDLPYEFRKMVREAFLPLPSHPLDELKGRAAALLHLSESETSQIAHRDAITLISAAAERLHHNPRAHVNDLLDTFSSNRAKNRDEGFVVKIQQRDSTLEVNITANSYIQRLFRASDAELSRTKTREIIATVIEVADALMLSEHAPNNLKVTVRSALGSRQSDMPFLWEVREADLYRVGFQSGREIKLALKRDEGIT